jgi:hypothetical protein
MTNARATGINHSAASGFLDSISVPGFAEGTSEDLPHSSLVSSLTRLGNSALD